MFLEKKYVLGVGGENVLREVKQFFVENFVSEKEISEDSCVRIRKEKGSLGDDVRVLA